MTELELYKKMYSTLLGEVDDILTEIDRKRELPEPGWSERELIYGRLKRALEDVEEIYISVEDVEDEDPDNLEDHPNVTRL